MGSVWFVRHSNVFFPQKFTEIKQFHLNIFIKWFKTLKLCIVLCFGPTIIDFFTLKIFVKKDLPLKRKEQKRGMQHQLQEYIWHFGWHSSLKILQIWVILNSMWDHPVLVKKHYYSIWMPRVIGDSLNGVSFHGILEEFQTNLCFDGI